MDFKLIIAGVVTVVGGTFLVQSLGLTESCSSEVTSKLVGYLDYIPALAGSALAWIGGTRATGRSLGGFKKW